MDVSTQLQHLWKKGQDFLDGALPILGGAMTWVSNHELVSAISNAGGFGILACGAMPPDILREEIKKTHSATQKPFGVNLITMHPDLQQLMEICIEQNIQHVFLAGGLPKLSDIKFLKEHNVKVIAFAPAVPIAKRLIKNGVDALIIEGSEAGGHIGPVSTSVLAQEILPVFSKELPIFVAGGIGRGESIVNYLRMGAAGCQLGSLFVCSDESPAHANFKKAFIKAPARDAVVSIQLDERFPVIPVRALANNAMKEFHTFQRQMINEYEAGHVKLEDAQLKIEKFWAGALRKAVVDGDVENGSLMAGQSVGLVTEIKPAKAIISELIGQANAYLLQRDVA